MAKTLARRAANRPIAGDACSLPEAPVPAPRGGTVEANMAPPGDAGRFTPLVALPGRPAACGRGAWAMRGVTAARPAFFRLVSVPGTTADPSGHTVSR